VLPAGNQRHIVAYRSRPVDDDDGGCGSCAPRPWNQSLYTHIIVDVIVVAADVTADQNAAAVYSVDVHIVTAHSPHQPCSIFDTVHVQSTDSRLLPFLLRTPVFVVTSFFALFSSFLLNFLFCGLRQLLSGRKSCFSDFIVSCTLYYYQFDVTCTENRSIIVD